MRHHKFAKRTRMLICVIGLLSWDVGNCATQTLMVSEGKRLEATISPDVMNRITVVNDRITNIFGDEGTFVTQTDDQSGQVFIKPTVENGPKPISLTVITENGVTQDFTLNPTDSAASTILLKNTNASQTSNPGANYEFLFSTQNSSNMPSSKDQFVQIMKQAVLGELALSSKSAPNRRPVLGFKTSLIKTYQSGTYLVSVWMVKRTDKSTEHHERLFYQPGDLAISLQDQCLKDDKKTLLYVLTRK